MNKKENLAFVFPGQGSQKVGMLAEFADGSACFRETFDEASDVLGYDLWSLIQDGPQEKLNMTEVTQPALLTASVALWRMWLDNEGATPSYFAGHSLGEWSALVCSNVVDFSSAVKLVQLRGRYMQEAVPAGEGAMAAIIGLSDEQVEEICAEVSTESLVVSPVNYNSPGQLVIAGSAPAVEAAIPKCSEAGAKRALPLPVSAPFHTSLMKPAADKLGVHIEETLFREPEVPVVHNVHAKPELDPKKIRTLMVEQIYSPVKWVNCIEYLASTSSVELLIECGPGKVLCGLTKRINKSLVGKPLESAAAFGEAIGIVNG